MNKYLKLYLNYRKKNTINSFKTLQTNEYNYYDFTDTKLNFDRYLVKNYNPNKLNHWIEFYCNDLIFSIDITVIKNNHQKILSSYIYRTNGEFDMFINYKMI